MNIQDDVVRSIPLVIMLCPDCGDPMRVSTAPTAVPSKVEITFRCDLCDCDLKRVSRPKAHRPSAGNCSQGRDNGQRD
jgi:hypothetical protein